MAESSLFLAGKLSKPDALKTSSDEDSNSINEIKQKKDKSEVEKPWVGTAALRDLGKRNEARNKVTQLQSIVPTVPKVPLVDNVPSVGTVPIVLDVPTVDKTQNTSNHSSVAPTKDFHRVPNSINRIALEGGMFTRPSCKHVYDALYLLTRGAIQPSRKIQIGRKALQRKANIGSDKTLDAAVASLQDVGLLKVDIVFGSQKGNIYEVFLPEEINSEINKFSKVSTNTDKGLGTEGTLGTIGTNSTGSTLGYKAPDVPSVENTIGTLSQTVDKISTYSSLNTSLKTNTKNDDEAFAAFNEVFKKACEKISGKLPNKNQQVKWKELAELLVMELEVAAARTTSVSNVPAFLTEHLRRRLMPVKKEVPKSKSKQSSSDGKSQTFESIFEPIEEYQAEPLTEQGRELTLKAFAGYIEKGQQEFLMGMQESYTTEDWKWLMEKLEASDKT
jgi:hypothetical protein